MGGLSETDQLSAVALVVSVIALVGSVMGLLQQYLSSAEGYKNCGPQVMGEWAMTRKRKFRWGEVRFETQFESPVIFVCRPDNQKGPLKGAPVWHVQGTEKSEVDTMTPSVETEERHSDMQRASKKYNENVHTADNERANWFILLQALHAMEKKSETWQGEQLAKDRTLLGPPGPIRDSEPKVSHDLPGEVAPWAEHTAVAALQRKQKSWDVMPGAVKKPYATTTFCHIIEMAAMLGLHWREFDRSAHKYHAEGNGYLLTGHDVDDLGLMFHFQIYGKNVFGQRRIIPSEEIKSMAFGNVTTIYRDAGKKSDFDTEDPKNSEVLQLGSASELTESLTHYGCNAKTANYFRDEKKKHAHLFPVVFEVLGMVGKSVYIPDTYFRYLPNPTTYSWNRKNFSLRKLLLEFNHALKDGDYIEPSMRLDVLRGWSDDLAEQLTGWTDEDAFSITLLRCLHRSIQRCDDYLSPKDPTESKMKFKWVKLVVREHIQEVMKILNETSPSSSSSSSPSSSRDADDSDDSTLASKDRQQQAKKTSSPTAFEELNSAAPELRNAKLIEIYFTTVLPAVAKNSRESLKKRTTAPYVPSVASQSDFALMSASGAARGESTSSPAAAAAAPKQRSNTPTLMVRKSEADDVNARLRSAQDRDEEQAGEIWCTLVFRMLCWLLLHDFNKKDVQISKSELYGSRLPVYIA